ncbi:protein rep [Sporosarcina sp. BP05]|uniref:protein rep n=1 Tax=Sporosarcina sp. BP05 TaxID=2758726 RepID=UPI002107242C|nr:protein rep [Sporosarcina sp. BP05]
MVLEKFTPKKDLNRRAANYMEKHVSVKTVLRFETCSSFMLHATNAEMSARKMVISNRCGNRFCPVCTWGTAKKDAIKLSIILEAIRDIEDKEFLFLTLTAPNCTGEELGSEIDRFNKAVNKLFQRRNVKKIAKGYARKLEVTTDQEQYVTEELYKRKKPYYDRRSLNVGDPNPTYNSYHPHLHILVTVNKSYFNKPEQFISKAEWLAMWRECMEDDSITQVDAKKASVTGKSNAVLEIAKYSAKGSDLYHSEIVFDTFYTALKKRQLLVYGGMMKDYAKLFKNGDLDKYKKVDEDEYTHMLRSVWKASKYENVLRKFTPEEYENYNQRALLIEENNEVR